jgi:hypothetical protein
MDINECLLCRDSVFGAVMICRCLNTVLTQKGTMSIISASSFLQGHWSYWFVSNTFLR